MQGSLYEGKEQHVRMRTDASPTQEQKPKVAANNSISRGEIILLALIVSVVVGMFCYKAGEWKGAAKVASVTQPTTLEDLRDKYGSQEWAVAFDDKHVVAMWDEPRKLMSYLHLASDDYAALCGERSNWTREDRFSAMASAAIRRRDTHVLSISNPLKK